MSINVTVVGATGVSTSITNSDIVNVGVGTAFQAQVPQLLVEAGANITVTTASGSFTVIGRDPPVQSVQGRTGAVVLTRADLTAAAATHQHTASDITNLTSVANVVSVNGITGTPTIVAGSNVTVTTSSASIVIAAGGGGGAVDSVAGRTGAVVLGTTDITNLTSVANVVSVNGKTGVVSMSAVDVTAASSTHAHNYVTALNGQTGNMTIVAGGNVTVTTSAGSIVISSTGGGGGTSTSAVDSVNGITGTPTIVAGSNVTVTTSGSSIVIDAAGGGTAQSLAIGTVTSGTAAAATITGTPPLLNLTLPVGSFGDAQTLKSVGPGNGIGNDGLYTLQTSDAGKMLLVDSSSVTIGVVCPPDGSVSIPVGTHIDIARMGVGAVSALGSTGVTVNCTPGYSLRAQYSTGTLIKAGTNTWLLVGDLST